MADRTWQDLGGDWANSNGNWGTALVNGDRALVPRVSFDINVNPTALGAINLLDLMLGFDVRKSLGTSAAPLTFGACTGKFDINCPNAGEIHLAPTSVPDVVVRASGNTKFSCHLKSGTYQRIKINTTGRVLIGGAAVVQSRIQLIKGTLLIEAGANLTGCDIEQSGGQIENLAAVPGGVYGSGGMFTHTGSAAVGAASVDIGTIRSMAGWLAYIDMKSTVTKIAGHGGRVDYTRDSRAKIVTTAYALRGAVIDATGNHVTFTTAEELGGRIFGASNVTQIFDMEP